LTIIAYDIFPLTVSYAVELLDKMPNNMLEHCVLVAGISSVEI